MASLSSTVSFVEVPWFHGFLPREDVVTLLKLTGDFLVRTTEPFAGQKRHYVLSIKSVGDAEDSIKHVIFKPCSDGIYQMGGRQGNIADLINYFWKSEIPVSYPTTGEMMLKSAIFRQHWELCHSDITLLDTLGHGEFGQVQLGKVKWIKHQYLDCAVKIAKFEGMTKEQSKIIMHEARLMRGFDHPNIVKLYGVAALKEPLLIVMELASHGALHSYLQKNGAEMDLVKKLRMAVCAAFGIEYLHHVNVIHRDIAARNCLISGDQIKISDFGMAIAGPVYFATEMQKVPVRWLPPEAVISRRFSYASDVYSFGILCWEIYSNAVREPFCESSAADVVKCLRSCQVLKLSPELPKPLEFVVETCRSTDFEKRPEIYQIAKMLINLMESYEAGSAPKRPKNLVNASQKVKKKKKRDASVGPVPTMVSRGSVKSPEINQSTKNCKKNRQKKLSKMDSADHSTTKRKPKLKANSVQKPHEEPTTNNKSRNVVSQ